MRHADFAGWLFGCAIAATSATAFAQAAGWTPEFTAPKAGAQARTAPLRIHVAGIPADTPQRLAVELDDIDVTSLAALDGDDIVITPAQPLDFGRHHLRLVENTRDGGIAERGNWRFEIRESAAFVDAHIQANATLNASARVAKHNADSGAGAAQGSGSAQVQAAVDNGSWKAAAMASLIANSQAGEGSAQGRRVDIGQYLLSAQRGAVSVSLGDHQALGPDSLVMQDFARRGLSADITAGSVARVTGFSMHATPLAGTSNFTGLADSHDRVNGVVATYFPVPGRPESLAVSGTYVSGGGTTDSGAGIVGSAQASSGSATSVVADAQLFDQLLRLRGEFARSGFDFDGQGSLLGNESGHAYSGLANYTPWRGMLVLGQPLTWNVGAQKEVLSTFFRSPANPEGISDRDMRQVFSGLNWYGLNLQASAAREHDNVDDLALVPKTESAQHSVSLNYAPPLASGQTQGGAPALPWYGQPNFAASYTGLKKDLIANPGALPLSLGPLHRTTSLLLSAQFQYASWNWSLAHNRVADIDYAGQAPESRTTSDRLDTAFMIATVNVGASLEHDETDDVTNGTHTKAMVGGTTLGYSFSDRLTSNLAYTARHAWSDGPAPDDQIVGDTTLGLNWALIAATGLQPGVSLGLDGSYHTCKDKSAGAAPSGTLCLDSYQAFVRVSVSWSPSI